MMDLVNTQTKDYREQLCDLVDLKKKLTFTLQEIRTYTKDFYDIYESGTGFSGFGKSPEKILEGIESKMDWLKLAIFNTENEELLCSTLE